MIDMTALGGVVSAFASAGTIAVMRPGAVVTTADGRRVNGASVAVTGVVGSVWPITGDGIGVDEDGRRMDNVADIYVLQELTVADDATGQPGDVVTHLGVEYEIISRQTWARGAFFVYTGRSIGHP